jgi:itaconate CoA-transferase
MLGLQNEREWKIFCARVLAREELAGDPRFCSNALRVEHRAALSDLIVTAFAALSADEVVRRLDAAGIANARVNTMNDVWQHPQLDARGRWTEIDSPVGPVRALLPVGAPSAYEPRMDAIPDVGQHSVPILTELGFNDAFIDRLKTDHAI